MPCSCFGKKDKKGGVIGGGEDEKYRPRDSHEREPLAPIPIPVSQTKKAQPLLEGAAPPPTAPATTVTAAAPGTPPSSEAEPTNTNTTAGAGGGDAARLRPEDDPDKANRRRDVVASFYSDQCELIGFKTTGSRPPSAHVGPDGPAATSSPATSSPSSTRSGSAAICRADLIEKRKEFFKDLTIEDDDSTSPRGGSRPTSRLTDPGSQPTPRQSQFQESLEKLHHTLPHLKKTPSPRSKNFSTSTPLVPQQQPFERNTSTAVSPSDDEREPLLPHSSPEQAPKIVPKKPDHTEIPKQPSLDIVSNFDLHDDVSDEAPLLSVKETHPDSHLVIESSVSTTVQKVSPEILLETSDDIERKENLGPPESKAPDLLVDFTTTEVNRPDLNVAFPTEPTESSKVLVDLQTQPVDSTEPTESSKVLVDLQTQPMDSTEPTESSKVLFDLQTQPVDSAELLIDSPSIEGKDLFKNPENDRLFDHVLHQNSVIVESSSLQSDSQVPHNVTDLCATNQSPFVVDKADKPFTRSEEINVNISAPEIITGKVDPFAFDSRGLDESPKVISGSPKVDPFMQLDAPFSVEAFSAGSPTAIENQFNVDFSNDHQTRPVIIEETLKEHPKEHGEHPKEHEHRMFDYNPENTHMSFENAIDQTPQTQTIVETTRQFISGSPDEQKTSQTIVETTRQFITAPPEEQTSQTIIETTHHAISVGDHPEDLEEEAPQTIVETTRHFITGVPEGEESDKFLELAQQFTSGSPDEETIVKTTTQQFVSGSPEDAFSETIVKTTQRIVSGDAEDGDNSQKTVTTTIEKTSSFQPPATDAFFLTSVEEPDEVQSEKLLIQNGMMTTTTTVTSGGNTTFTVVETEVPEHLTKSLLSDLHVEEGKEEPELPDVPCFGVPPPPSSPPPPLPEGQVIQDTLTSPSAVVIPSSGGEELLPPAPPTPPTERHHEEASTLVEEYRQFEFEPSAPVHPSDDKEDLPPAPPTPPTPRVDDLMLSKSPPLQPPPAENEASLPPTPPTPLREDEEIAPPAAPVTPRKESKKKRKKNKNKANANANAPTSPSSPNATSPSNNTTTTCGVEEIVVSSNLEDDGLGSEIDDALETLECLSEEGNIERAAASS